MSVVTLIIYLKRAYFETEGQIMLLRGVDYFLTVLSLLLICSELYCLCS
jgi:hypothetical protein